MSDNNSSTIGQSAIDGDIQEDRIEAEPLPRASEEQTAEDLTSEGFEISLPVICSRIATGELVVFADLALEEDDGEQYAIYYELGQKLVPRVKKLTMFKKLYAPQHIQVKPAPLEDATASDLRDDTTKTTLNEDVVGGEAQS